jgi:predicted regulator of Ras-like GTPase activity (Roadblock/LC7/MglB family)
MFTLPRLTQEDMDRMDGALDELIARSECSNAAILDKGGFIVASRGALGAYDLTTLAALAAASFTASQAIANLIQEPDFSSVYQQGKNFSILVNNVGEQCLLVVIFNAKSSVGAVKYYARDTILKVLDQLEKARKRAPEDGVDLSMMNLSDGAQVFRKQA